MDEEQVEYAGFWIRVLASLIDTLLIVAITIPVLIAIFGFNREHTGWLAGMADE